MTREAWFRRSFRSLLSVRRSAGAAPVARPSRSRPKAAALAGLLALVSLSLRGEPVRAESPIAKLKAAHAEELTTGHDFDEARRVLASADADDPHVALEKGRLALYEADCDGALVFLSRADVTELDEGEALADIARGCARVIAATVVERDEAAALEVRYQDEFDRALTPLLAETVVRAREALTRDLGVTWPKPTRIVVVRDLLSLSAMTGLPYEAAQTTGTVAVAKWGRVTLLSPRASHHGYAFRDTVAHELTHLAISRATVDRAPLWLQEGLAKREEVRWREPGPFDDKPTPDAIVQRGIEMKLDLPLDKLGPSIAMLPSADAAMVAFAQVTSFVRFYADTAGEGALPRLLAALRDRNSVDEALAKASGADLKQWDTRWRAHLASKPREPLPPLFALGADIPDARDLRERVRLAELLLGRGHGKQALAQLDRIKTEGANDDPTVRYLRARALEADGRLSDAAPLVADPAEVSAPYAPWWALRGRLARVRGDHGVADLSFVEARGGDPLDVEAACEGLEPTSRPRDVRLHPLCEAALARQEPGVGQD
jgi:hypothetical protein